MLLLSYMPSANWKKLTMPVLAVGGANSPVGGPNITTSSVVYGMKILAQNVQGIIVPNSGHWIPEERPDFVIRMLDNFLGDNTIIQPAISKENVEAYSMPLSSELTHMDGCRRSWVRDICHSLPRSHPSRTCS
ncbi:MAG TPA: alpha/beta hydrolase [Candidatus Eisenbacteria bacterium]|nr:alpha/beta hydrolase [Candidatus Eisenbacteria bacterium]